MLANKVNWDICLKVSIKDYFLSLFFYFLNWDIVALQCCINFCYTMK